MQVLSVSVQSSAWDWSSCQVRNDVVGSGNVFWCDWKYVDRSVFKL